MISRIVKSILWAAAISAGLVLGAKAATGQDLARIDLQIPCTYTMTPAVGAYSGDYALTACQFAVSVANVKTAATTFSVGVWKPMLGGCNGRSDLQFIGDCWQSVNDITASNGSPKWVVTANPPLLCKLGTGLTPPPGAPDAGGLMIWKWNAPMKKFDSVGLAKVVDSPPPPNVIQIQRLGRVVLDGDTAYPRANVGGSPKWLRCDLNAVKCYAALLDAPGGDEGRQNSVDGYTYSMHVNSSFPNVNGGPVHFYLLRSDQPVPTNPPAPSRTATRPGPTASPTRRATMPPGSDCCTPGVDCPPGAPIPWCTPRPGRVTATATRIPSMPPATAVPPTAPPATATARPPAPTRTIIPPTAVPPTRVATTSPPVATPGVTPSPTPSAGWSFLPSGCTSKKSN